MNTLRDRQVHPLTPRWQKLVLGGLFSVVLVGYIFWGAIVKEVDAGYYAVLENRLTGHLEPKMTPGKFLGPHLKVHIYRISGTYWFSVDPHEGDPSDMSINARYMDGGRANISGNVRWEMPDDGTKLIALHQKYGSQNNFMVKTMAPTVGESINVSAQLMTSTESYTAEKANYMRFAQDQVNEGVYILEPYTQIDTIGVEIKETAKNRIKEKPDRTFERKDNPLQEFGVRLSLLVIREPDYEPAIKKQISERRTRLMEEAISASRMQLAGEEDKRNRSQGEADLVQIHYTQEETNISEITAQQMVSDTTGIYAEGRRKVAAIMRQVSEIQGETEKLLGEGRATQKRLLQEADSNLDLRLEAYVDWHTQRASAFAEGQAPVPEYVLTAGASGSDMALQSIGIKALKDMTGAQGQ